MRIPDELKEMTIFLYYERCKKAHCIEFFTWFEKYRPLSVELVSKYVDKLKGLVSKVNDNLEELVPEPEEAEEEEEEETPQDSKSKRQMFINRNNKGTMCDSLKMKNMPSLQSKSTLSYLQFLTPEIDDFDMIGINLNSTLLKKSKINKGKVGLATHSVVEII